MGIQLYFHQSDINVLIIVHGTDFEAVGDDEDVERLRSLAVWKLGEGTHEEKETFILKRGCVGPSMVWTWRPRATF